MLRLGLLLATVYCIVATLCTRSVGAARRQGGRRAGGRRGAFNPLPLFESDAFGRLFSTPEPALNSSLTQSARVKRQLVIPNGLTVGIVPRFDYTVFKNSNGEQLVVSVDVEIDYNFPTSASSGKSGLDRISRLLYDKQAIYSGLETVFTRFGLDGKACTKRAICEVGQTPDHDDGLLGDFLGYLLSASYGVGRRQELKQYYQAEYYGRKYGNCAAIFPSCPISIFTLVDASESDEKPRRETRRESKQKSSQKSSQESRREPRAR